MQNTFDDWKGEYLEHYGVLGMKWGQRRYQNPDGSLTAAGVKRYNETGEYGYTYKSHATKKYTRKAARAQAKLQKQVSKSVAGKDGEVHVNLSGRNVKKMAKLSNKIAKYKNRAERSKELDAREQEYAQRVRASGNIAMRLLTGVVGSKPYQQHMAMNKDTTSTGSKITSAIMTNIGGYPLSYARKALYLRQDEHAAKRAAKGKSADRGASFREKSAAAKARFESGINNVSGAASETWKKRKG